MNSDQYLRKLKYFLHFTIESLIIIFVILAYLFLFFFHKLKDFLLSISIENFISSLILLFVILYYFFLFYFRFTPKITANLSHIIATLIGLLLLALFIISIKEWLESFERNKIIPWVTFQVLVIPLSIFLSRYLVSTSIGLPPQDYDLTILAITPFFYVYVVCFFISLIALIKLLLPFLGMFIGSWVNIFVTVSFIIMVILFLNDPEFLINYIDQLADQPDQHYLIILLIGILGMFATFLDRYKPLNLKKTDIWSAFKNNLRNMSIIAACCFLIEFYAHVVIKSSHRRLIAYYLDYFKSPNYPGLNSSEKVHIHENGVISYAIKNGFDVQIRVDKYD